MNPIGQRIAHGSAENDEWPSSCCAHAPADKVGKKYAEKQIPAKVNEVGVKK
jgi:hypothetical protein